MFFLVFHMGGERYLLEAKRIIEVIPFVELKKVPKVPDYLVGMLNYRGKPVPVIDMCMLAENKPSSRLMSTRIVLVKYPGDGVNDAVIGLITEHATEMIKKEPSDFMKSGLNNKETPYLTMASTDDEGIMQWVDVNKLLPDALLEMLTIDDIIDCA